MLRADCWMNAGAVVQPVWFQSQLSRLHERNALGEVEGNLHIARTTFTYLYIINKYEDQHEQETFFEWLIATFTNDGSLQQVCGSQEMCSVLLFNSIFPPFKLY
jgi:hypothetical protein